MRRTAHVLGLEKELATGGLAMNAHTLITQYLQCGYKR